MFQSTLGLFYQAYQGLDYIKYSYICNSFNTYACRCYQQKILESHSVLLSFWHICPIGLKNVQSTV